MDSQGYISLARNAVEALTELIIDPSSKLNKEQIAKMIPKTNAILGTIAQMAAKMATLEGELTANKALISKPNYESNSVVSMCEAADELEDRKNRAKNLIIINVPESSKSNQIEKISDDNLQIINILNKIDNNIESNSISTFRLGAVRPDKSRPIKVILRNSTEAMNILRKKNVYLTNSPIKIYSDQTPNQRKYLTDLRQTMESRIQGGEIGLTIKFINNKPSIVKITPKNSNPLTGTAKTSEVAARNS